MAANLALNTLNGSLLRKGEKSLSFIKSRTRFQACKQANIILKSQREELEPPTDINEDDQTKTTDINEDDQTKNLKCSHLNPLVKIVLML
jgi:hypothetical protein